MEVSVEGSNLIAQDEIKYIEVASLNDLRHKFNTKICEKIASFVPSKKWPEIGTVMLISQDLIDIGFTRTMITKFLPSPKIIEMTRHKVCHLHDSTIVEKVINSEDFSKYYESSINKRNSARARAAKQIEKNISIVNSIPIHVEILTKKQLYRNAVDSWNEWNGKVWEGEIESEESKRIMGNYARHELTTYDEDLLYIAGKYGKILLYEVLRDKVMEAVYSAYPFLR